MVGEAGRALKKRHLSFFLALSEFELPEQPWAVLKVPRPHQDFPKLNLRNRGSEIGAEPTRNQDLAHPAVRVEQRELGPSNKVE